MEIKFWMFLVTGLVPVIIGFIYYNPAVFGKAWMSSAGLDKKDLEGGNLPLLLILTYIFGVFVSAAVFGLVIHQSGLYSILANDPEFMKEGSEATLYFASFIEKYGDVNRDFGHGAFHGVFIAILFAMPIVGMSAIYERRGWKYILVHTGFWIVCLALMCGMLAQFM